LKYFVTTSIAFFLCAAPASAADWTLDHGQSSVTFETTAFSQAVTGSFTSFGAEIALDPNDLTSGSINAYVDTSSLETENPDVEDALLGEDGFDTQGYMRATFASHEIHEADQCSEQGARCLVASGTLTIRGVNQPLDLPFTLSVDGSHAIADGAFVVKRSDFHIGTLEWQFAGRETTVHLHIVADTTP